MKSGGILESTLETEPAKAEGARAATLGTLEMLGLGAAFFEAFPAELGGVTLEEINAYIKDILAPARASWVRIGPKK